VVFFFFFSMISLAALYVSPTVLLSSRLLFFSPVRLWDTPHPFEITSIFDPHALRFFRAFCLGVAPLMGLVFPCKIMERILDVLGLHPPPSLLSRPVSSCFDHDCFSRPPCTVMMSLLPVGPRAFQRTVSPTPAIDSSSLFSTPGLHRFAFGIEQPAKLIKSLDQKDALF